MHYLTPDEVIVLHDYAVQRFGGALELADRGKLEASVAAPMQSFAGVDLYPDLWSKAAIILFLLIKNHPFVDGNKRTALLSMIRFIEINGFTLADVNDEELYEFTIKVASSLIDKEAIASWLRSHSNPITS